MENEKNSPVQPDNETAKGNMVDTSKIQLDDDRRYYNIKEVAEMFHVRPSLLRFWEQEFPHLRPKTTGNKVRQYSKQNIAQLKVIYNLVKVRGFKLSAARKMLQQNRSGADKSAEILNSLISVRDELRELKKQFDTLE